MLKKIVLAAAVVGAMSAPAFAEGQACVHAAAQVAGTPAAISQCIPLP
jgi:hypothetical protein